MASRQCNLECVKDQREGEVIEFVGPVKIVLVDQPTNVYRRRVWGASFIVLAQMLMAATTMTLLFYALSYKTDFFVALHVFVCTVGYQLFVPSAILSLNKQNGAAAPMRIPDRQFEHVLLMFLGIAMAVGATD
ncbi:uncharacterized protein [Epargyreus clarus]|uniref:uncharacterized protein isoform X2 n=1 Tax=Epargyreus clarus TaxID=520877 RepID=UPI003C2EC925